MKKEKPVPGGKEFFICELLLKNMKELQVFI
jgi:hypothetical protein